jgi:hypothetical protein
LTPSSHRRNLRLFPATHTNETWRDVGIVLPTEIVDTTIQKGIAPKSQVAIVPLRAVCTTDHISWRFAR